MSSTPPCPTSVFEGSTARNSPRPKRPVTVIVSRVWAAMSDLAGTSSGWRGADTAGIWMRLTAFAKPKDERTPELPDAACSRFGPREQRCGTLVVSHALLIPCDGAELNRVDSRFPGSAICWPSLQRLAPSDRGLALVSESTSARFCAVTQCLRGNGPRPRRPRSGRGAGASNSRSRERSDVREPKSRGSSPNPSSRRDPRTRTRNPRAVGSRLGRLLPRPRQR